MKIAIVEDNPADIRVLAALVEKYFLREGIIAEIETFNSGEDLLAEWPFEIDLVLLDIRMARLNGIETASKIRETNERVVIIFVTNNPQYSLAGYAVDALDYLCKPITFELLDRVLLRALRRLENSDRSNLTIRNNDGYFVVNPMDINFVEMENRKVVIHTKTGLITCTRTLNYMQEKLPGTFFRCHSAFLINLYAVESLKDQCAISALTNCMGDIL